jgi:hypothetical protein
MNAMTALVPAIRDRSFDGADIAGARGYAGLMLAAVMAIQAASPAFAQDARPGAAATLVPGAGSVAVAVARTPVDARALGMSESKGEYCARHDPAAAASVQLQLKLLERGLGEDRLAEIRRSEAYRAAFEAETMFLGRVDDRNATRVCEAAAARHRPG